MKYFVLPILFVTLFAASANAQKKTEIQGTFNSSITSSTITLENYLTPALFNKAVDIKDNSFSVVFDCEREDIYKLKLADKNFLALVIRPGDKITVKLDPTTLSLNPAITGSEQSARIYEVENSLAGVKKSQDSLNTVYAALSSTDAVRKSEIEKQYNFFETQKNILIYNAIANHMGDLVNMFFIERLSIDQFYPLYAATDSALYPKYDYNQAVISLHTKVISSKTTAVGSLAPEIKLPTPEGDSLSLYSIKGKVIIIDFWASWCRPCRQENPNMTSLYADFHTKGLEIFGVSLDKDKAAWVKAIADDKLIWKHVSDLKYWQSEAAKLYGVGSIPSMFVLDGDYKIIAKNLRGEQLRAFVAEKLN